MLRKGIFAVVVVFLGALVAAAIARTAAQSASPALTGVVSSQEEETMEGVLVSAKRSDSSITVTVVSDATGRYSFPRDRLEAGTYSIRIRAAGYDLDGAGTATVAAQQTARAALTSGCHRGPVDRSLGPIR